MFIQRNKLGQFVKGFTPWNKNNKGYKLSEEHRKNIGKGHLGLKRSKETKKKLSIQKLGDKNPAKRIDVRKKMSEAKKGKPGNNKGKHWKIQE
jgi:hypothetical protein